MSSEPKFAGVIPRWEWRTFAAELPKLRAQLPLLQDALAKVSLETYLVCRTSSHDAKIRADVLDVKQLFGTDADGLQLWKPVLKESFPLTAAGIRSLFAIWGQVLPAPSRKTYLLQQFLDEIIGSCSGVRAVQVKKSRIGFQFMSCTAEIALVEFDGITCETFCLEHEDTALIMRALDCLNLRATENVNYAAAIKHAIAFGSLAA